jgi:hypothetical protein
MNRRLGKMLIESIFKVTYPLLEGQHVEKTMDGSGESQLSPLLSLLKEGRDTVRTTKDAGRMKIRAIPCPTS